MKNIRIIPLPLHEKQPCFYVDDRGDSINVAQKYRETFNNILKAIYGNNASNFSYSTNGNLIYNGSKNDFEGDEKKYLKICLM